jgi:hypothetical protein
VTVPYDTGKVKIGLAYEPPSRRLMSRDEEELQCMLIGPGLNEGARLNPSTIWYGLTAGVAIATIALMIGA